MQKKRTCSSQSGIFNQEDMQLRINSMARDVTVKMDDIIKKYEMMHNFDVKRY